MPISQANQLPQILQIRADFLHRSAGDNSIRFNSLIISKTTKAAYALLIILKL